MIRTAVQSGDFDPGAELAALGPHGAVASFIGHVRADDGVETLFLEHHPAMTQAALETLAAGAMRRWPLAAVTLIHRTGALAANARIVLVATASPHRSAALDACAYLIDRLKTDVPLWKKELLAGGEQRWVEHREADAARAEGWGGV
jgi:molybdopterin synthase catalytic subunit